MELPARKRRTTLWLEPNEFRANAEVHGLENTFVGIEWLVARVAHEGNGRHGRSHRFVFGRDEVLNKQVSESSTLKGVAKLQPFRLGSVQDSFNLK